MKRFILKRFRKIDDGTLGELYLCNDAGEKIFSCFTLEPSGPDTTERNTDRRVPSGLYQGTWHNSPKYKGLMPHIYNELVPKDRYILIHIGNYPKDTLGCILVGRAYHSWGVSSSKVTFNILIQQFMRKNEPFELEIRNGSNV